MRSVRGQLLAQARAQLGVIGVLVNNASMFEYDALMQQAPLSVELFEQALAGEYLCADAADTAIGARIVA